MNRPSDGWNRSRGNSTARSRGGRTAGNYRSGTARASVSFFRKFLSLGTWLLILGLLIAAAKGMDQKTFGRLVNGIRVLRHQPPARTEPPRPPPESRTVAESSPPPPSVSEKVAPEPAAAEITDIQAVVPVPVPAVAAPPAEPEALEEPPPRIAQVIIPPARNGNFFVRGKINGQDVLFVVDTGASAVAVPEKLQQKLYLPRGRYGRSATAGGYTGMFETKVKELSIGPIELKDIPAVINPKAPDDIILLGMTALREVRMLHEDGKMILQQELPPEAPAAPPAPPPPKLKKSIKECMGDDKVVNARVFKCMQGQEEEP